MHKLKHKKTTLFPWLFLEACLSLLLFCHFTPAQKPVVAFKNYSVDDGLSHNYIRDILQDKDGLIWIATEDGLNKFNGYTFQVYRNIADDSTSISDHPIIALAQDDDENIWIGTWGGGLFVYNKRQDNFKSIKYRESQSDGISSNLIDALWIDSQGRVWIGTGDSGLDMYDPQQQKFFHYKHNPEDTNSLSHNRVMSITEGQDGMLWLGTMGGGLNRLDPETGTFTRFWHEEGNPHSLSGNDVFEVFFDSKQRLWVGTWGSGLNLMDGNTQQFTRFQHKPGNASSLGSNEIWSIAETHDGRIWIGTDHGLALYHEAQNNFYVYEHDPFDPKSIADNPIKSMFCDRDGRLWVGTYNRGISIFDKQMNLFRHYYKKYNQNAIAGNNISFFLPLSPEQVLIGTDGKGLSLFDLKDEHFTHYEHDSEDPGSLSNNKVKTMLMDSKGSIWIGFWNGGLDHFDREKNTFTHIKKGENRLSNDNVVCMAEDQDGYLWIGTFGGGLHKFNPDDLSFEYFTKNAERSESSIRDHYIWSVLVDRQNNVWVGGSSGYLDVWDSKTEKFIYLNIYEAEEVSHSIEVLFEDTKGRIWVGTEGGGLKVVDDKENGTIRTFTTQDGLPSNNIQAIEEDDQGRLWISTNHGIAHFDPETAACRNFRVSDGLQGLYFSRQASASLPSGELMFGGTNGFNIFHPDSLKVSHPKTPLVFTNFQIFNKPVSIHEKGSPLQVPINETESITLSYQQSVFSIEYAGINYTNPEEIKYKYKLEGFVDERWQEAGYERKVTYTNLNPGKYTFVVTTTGANMPENEQRMLAITVTPPWWQTWWARVLLACLLIGVVVGGYKLRLRNIKQQNKRLEKEVHDRTLKLQQANNALRQANEFLHEKNLLIQEQKEEIHAQAEELVESNEEIRSINQRLEESVEIRTADLRKSNQELDNFVYRVSHDIRAPLSSILGLVDLIEDEKDPYQLKAYLKMATKSIHKLDGFVRDILDYSRNSRMDVIRQEIDFPLLLKEVREELQYMENASRLKLEVEYHLEEAYYNDIRRLQIIFRNLYSNAIKYQNLRISDNYLKIEVVTNHQMAQITVTDNGIGINTSQLTKVFDMFYRGSDLSSGSGIGLYIVKETIEKLGGSIELKSEIGMGTIIRMNLPNVQKNLLHAHAGSLTP